MEESFYLFEGFCPLNRIYIGKHLPLLAKVPSQASGDKTVGVETSNGDELPHVTIGTKFVLELFCKNFGRRVWVLGVNRRSRRVHTNILVGEAMSGPVEGRRQVVSQHGVGVDLLYSLSKFFCLVNIGRLCERNKPFLEL